MTSHIDTDYRPHPTLKRYYTDDSFRQENINRAFDQSARHYDRINRILSLGTDKWYRRNAIARAGVAEGMNVLDVGCGTGLAAKFAGERVGPSGIVVGIDPSIGMLKQATIKGRVRLPALGQAESLPFPDDTFDLLTMSYALRHVSSLAVAFSEYRRVLKPGGKVLLLELTLPPAGLALGMFRIWMKYLVPWIARGATGNIVAQRLYSYCWDTFDQCVPPELIMGALRDAGFGDVSRRVEMRVFSEYLGKK